jgi:N-formylglutamate deformylase
MNTFELLTGDAPLLISVPHSGVALPPDIAGKMTTAGHAVADTDWFVDALYAPIARALGASMISANYSRYVVDLNRPPDGGALYPGMSETGLCPQQSFTDEPLYLDDTAPDAAEIARRKALYWQPYHAALAAQLARLRAQHGQVLLWDAHSIAAEVPKFFSGRLPDLNFGTNSGASAADVIAAALLDVAKTHVGLSHVMNGRFKGGFITRHYGQPTQGVHAVQLELSQDCYMAAGQQCFDSNRAALLSGIIRHLLSAALSALEKPQT